MEPIDHLAIESATEGACEEPKRTLEAASGLGLLAWILIGSRTGGKESRAVLAAPAARLSESPPRLARRFFGQP
jgi:hypothetical protein